MRESIGGAWILGIVMTFVVLFASFLAISINYSKAFKVKNNVVDLIEKHEGVTDEAVDAIWSYLQTEGYILKGHCDNDYVGFDRDGRSTTDDAVYCIKKNTIDSDERLERAYYSVQVFFRLDLPMLGEIFTFKVSGETMSINFAKDDYYLEG